MRRYTKGFTLVELLTVIAVIGTLATVLITVINPLDQIAKARDAQRKSDLAQIQRGLEQYYNDNGRYPPASTTTMSSPECRIINTTTSNPVNWGASYQPYFQTLPIDPRSANGRRYCYTTASNDQIYRLYTSLERGAKDSQACVTTPSCMSNPNQAACQCASATFTCGSSGSTTFYCNYGVTSPNAVP